VLKPVGQHPICDGDAELHNGAAPKTITLMFAIYVCSWQAVCVALVLLLQGHEQHLGLLVCVCCGISIRAVRARQT